MRNEKIQIVRAVLAAMVVLIHSMPIGNDMLRVYLRPFCNVAVAGFIFLSGYLTKTEFDTKKFYIKRITTALVPFIAFTALYSVIAKFGENPIAIIASFAKNLVIMDDSGPLYYLVAYMQLALLAPLLAKIAKQKNGIMHGVIMAIQPLFVACLYMGFIGKSIFHEGPFYIMEFPMWIAYYYLGMILGNKLIKINISKKALMILSLFGVFAQIGEGLFWINNCEIRDLYYSQIRFSAMIENIPIMLLIVRYIQCSDKNNNRILWRIGNASYGIYLLHWAIIMVWDKLLPRNNGTFIIVFIVSYVGSYLLTTFLNKILPKKVLKYSGLALSK